MLNSFRQIVCILAFGLVLSSCASRPEGVLVPVPVNEPSVSKVDLLVATTRMPTYDPRTLFSGERGSSLIVTDIGISIPPDKNRTVGQVQWPKKLPANPLKDFTTYRVTGLDQKVGEKKWLDEHVPANGSVMIFVHGFNNTFEDSVYRFAQIVHDSEAKVAPIIFTWPSRASIFDYNYDKDSTTYSRDALEEVIRSAAAHPKVKDITIMAHSMGTWLTMESLRQIAIRDGRIMPKVKDIILASPDLDVDVFSQQWLVMQKKAPKMTIFVSRDDRALSVSRRIAGNIDRLGQINPAVEPYRSALEATGIAVIDLTKLKVGDRLNHGKFAESPEVVQLIGKRLVAGQTITDSDIGLGERIGAVALGVGQGVGSAASIAVSTPIAIFDPTTRRTYNQQIDRFGHAVGGTLESATGQ
ncbi:alpha/beta hydrolase [Paenochrobactrum glaciei]|uniref:alpha/beta hydrolase n=1 Tax=Paenochrobactrum glaciei TaxID=486407 RepID=UPI0035BBABB8